MRYWIINFDVLNVGKYVTLIISNKKEKIEILRIMWHIHYNTMNLIIFQNMKKSTKLKITIVLLIFSMNKENEFLANHNILS